jgi:hypothetical protein
MLVGSRTSRIKRPPFEVRMLHAWRLGLFAPSRGSTLRGAGCGASAARCPSLFRATSRTEVRVRKSPSQTQEARRVDGLRCALSQPCGLGLSAPSMGLTPPRCALRGQRLRAVQICSRQICHCEGMDAVANIGAADGPKGEAQDVPSQRKVRVRKSPSHTQKARLSAGFLRMAGRLGFEPR